MYEGALADAPVCRESRVRVDYFVADVGLHDAEACEEESRLAPRPDDNLVVVDVDAARPLDVVGERGLDVDRTRRVRVGRFAALDSLDASLGDVRRCGEFRLTDLKVHDVAPLRL
jgi:hypothetical protein